MHGVETRACPTPGVIPSRFRRRRGVGGGVDSVPCRRKKGEDDFAYSLDEREPQPLRRLQGEFVEVSAVSRGEQDVSDAAATCGEHLVAHSAHREDQASQRDLWGKESGEARETSGGYDNGQMEQSGARYALLRKACRVQGGGAARTSNVTAVNDVAGITNTCLERHSWLHEGGLYV